VKKKNEKLAETITNRRAAKKNALEIFGEVPPITASPPIMAGGGSGVPFLDLSASQPIEGALITSPMDARRKAQDDSWLKFVSPATMAQMRTNRVRNIAQVTLTQMQEDILEQMVSNPDAETFEFHFVELPTDAVYIVLKELDHSGWKYKFHADSWELVISLPKVVEHAAKWITDPGKPL